MIGRQMNCASCERRHSRLACRSPMECLMGEEFIPKTLAENGAKSSSAPVAQVPTPCGGILKVGRPRGSWTKPWSH